MVVPVERSHLVDKVTQAGWGWVDDLVCYPLELASYLDDADLDYVEFGWKTGFQIRRFTH